MQRRRGWESPPPWPYNHCVAYPLQSLASYDGCANSRAHCSCNVISFNHSFGKRNEASYFCADHCCCKNREREDYKLNMNDTNEDSVRTLSHTTVTFYRNFRDYYSAKFTLTYSIKNMECTNEESFQCDDNFCIPRSKVCDGVKDCKNGSDEIGCETGVLAIQGVKEARKKAIDWMKRNRTVPWNWRDDMPRAVVALYLASHMNFNGTSLEEELMAKEAELKVALALLRWRADGRLAAGQSLVKVTRWLQVLRKWSPGYRINSK
ncbi:uncharacterized protein CG3556 [Trichonephila clavipes]|nr:uncharacterized protein CG3556 [Trichonephila clavipes]